MALSVAEAQSLWSPELVYLNTASFGLPPRPAWEALQAALADWRGGRANWEDWNDTTEPRACDMGAARRRGRLLPWR